MGKIIGITYDLKSDWDSRSGDPADVNAEFDKPETVQRVIEALESGGHTVSRFAFLSLPFVIPLENLIFPAERRVDQTAIESDGFVERIISNAPFKIPCGILDGRNSRMSARIDDEELHSRIVKHQNECPLSDSATNCRPPVH